MNKINEHMRSNFGGEMRETVWKNYHHKEETTKVKRKRNVGEGDEKMKSITKLEESEKVGRVDTWTEITTEPDADTEKSEWNSNSDSDHDNKIGNNGEEVKDGVGRRTVTKQE